MKRLVLFVTIVLLLGTGCTPLQSRDKKADDSQSLFQYVDTESGHWLVHDINRPAPVVVRSDQPCFLSAPEDAVVLFDGTDLSQWMNERTGRDAHWLVRDGYMEVRSKGGIKTRREFGSCQLHLEFATPAKVQGTGQGRGNSGVFLQGQYEVQVLDSYENSTYPDGQCAALYGRAVPLVNASRGPGQWQSYDIVYHRPLFQDGRVVRKATFTVFHNGVLVQDHVELDGGTNWINKHAVTGYKPHGDAGPIMLQDHGNPVRYRNIWVRPLSD